MITDELVALPYLPKWITDKLTLPVELVAKELVSNSVSCSHRDNRERFTILVEKTGGYTCTKCGEKHDKISDFFIENMAQRQLKAEEEK